MPTPSVLNTFLKGVRILDLSQYIPGPMATLMLSDMGAEVLKVEPPHGDGMQDLGPRDEDGRPVFYNALNAGKAVCRLNLKDNSDRSQFLDLLEEADVVIEGFRSGVMERLGIDYPVLRGRNPGIILCSVSGYGVGTSRSAEVSGAGRKTERCKDLRCERGLHCCNCGCGSRTVVLSLHAR